MEGRDEEEGRREKWKGEMRRGKVGEVEGRDDEGEGERSGGER